MGKDEVWRDEREEEEMGGELEKKEKPWLRAAGSNQIALVTYNPERHQSGVFCNDLGDHCFTACIRNGCSVKRPLLICHRLLVKNFN